jgi:pyruvate,water dikinase
VDTSRKRLLAESGCSWTDGLRENLGYFLQEAKLDSRIKEILQSLETEDLGNLRQRGRQIRQAILESTLPTSLEGYITEAYKQLSEGLAEPADVAVRSSATAEDLPDASFTGQQETYLNVQGPLALLEACKRCFASLFTDRAISYRTHKGFDHLKIALSIIDLRPRWKQDGKKRPGATR